MATRSAIGIMHGENCKSVYAHWDGYIAHNGVILFEHYDSVKTNELVSLGDVSSLRPEIGVKRPFSRFDTTMSDNEFDSLYGNMCTFYGRDRGENTTFKTHTSYKDFYEYYNNSGCEYLYIMKDGVWYVDRMQGAGLEFLAEFVTHEKETN
jgi:hypothetical protein